MRTDSVISAQVHKRLFIGLLAGSLTGILFLFLIIGYLFSRPADSAFYHIVFLTFLLAVCGGAILTAFGVAGIVLTLLAAKNFSFFQTPIQLSIHLFYPLSLLLGSLFGIDKDRVRRSFVEVNNQLVRIKKIEAVPRQILVLAPHCLQRTDCPHKITVDVNNCRRCGKCYIGDLLALRDRYGFNLGVATGGTLARKYVEEFRPKAIVAIACERDLTSGIHDVGRIPVLGVANQRPNGPCRDTCIKIERVEEAIKHFLA